MNRNSILAATAFISICGCQPTRSVQVSRTETEEERRFVADPCCQTTHGLVGTQHGAAVPLILATLDRLSGETNAWKRCSVIQGALWNADNCTNAQFHVIIERGNKDPSESVRVKTSHMVESRLKILGTPQFQKEETEPPPASTAGRGP